MNDSNLSKKENLVASMDTIYPVLKEVIDSGGEFSVITAGTSMKPLLGDRKDTVHLVKADSLKKFDIVLYKRTGGEYVLHRIMSAKNGVYTMCGDNQLFLERDITKDMVIAKVIRIIRNGNIVDICTSRLYRIYVFLWCRCFSIRYIILKCRAILLRLFNTAKN